MPRASGWDTAYGYELYLKGLKDGEIADALGVKICTITSYRHRHWKKAPDGGRGAPPPGAEAGTGEIATAPAGPRNDDKNLTKKEVAGMPMEIDESRDTAKMMEVIAKMTEGMGGIKAVCVGNIIQNLWNLNCVDDIRNARNILNWLEANYDFG